LPGFHVQFMARSARSTSRYLIAVAMRTMLATLDRSYQVEIDTARRITEPGKPGAAQDQNQRRQTETVAGAAMRGSPSQRSPETAGNHVQRGHPGSHESIALAHAHAVPPFNTAFYATVAIVIAVLFLAYTIQGGAYEKLLRQALAPP